MALNKRLIIPIAILFVFVFVFFIGLTSKVPTQSNNSNLSRGLDTNNAIKGSVSLRNNNLHESIEIGHFTNNAYLSMWMREKPKVIMNYILNIEEKKRRMTTLILAMKSWHEVDSNALGKWLLAFNKEGKLDDVIIRLCHSEDLAPVSLLVYANKIIDLDLRYNTSIELFKKWVKKDSDSAIKWVVSNDTRYKNYGPIIYQGIITLDFNRVLSSLHLLSFSELSTSSIILDLIGTQMKKFITKAYNNIFLITNTLSALPESEFKNMALLTLAPIIFEHSDTYDSMVFLESLPEGGTHDSLQHNLMRKLLAVDIITALDYIALLPDDKNKIQLLDTIMTQMATDDLSAANEWLTHLDSPPRSLLLLLVQAAIDKRNIRVASKWVKKLSYSKDVIEFELKITKLIHAEDQQLAIEYLQKIPHISQKNKSILLEYITNN